MSGTCGACGHPAQEPGQRFCGSCGRRLDAPAAAPEGERKQVTVLFADVAGSMELAERLDPDDWTAIMTQLFELCRGAVERLGGTVDKFTGDGVMALFGAPVAQEDHARRACHAALLLARDAAAYAAQLRPAGTELAIRVGLNSGEVVAGSVGTSAYTAVGHTVGLAQRMEAHAAPGGVCMSEHTAALVREDFELRDLGEVRVKGSSLPVRIFALDASAGRSAAPGRRRAGMARMVGRDTELLALRSALDEAMAGCGQVLGVVGEAGTGKSRLCDEAARIAESRGVTVRRTAGVSHATEVPLLPVLGLFRDYFDITDADSAAEVRDKISRRLLGLDPEFDADLGLVFDFLEVPDPQRAAPQLGQEARRRRVLDIVRRLTRRRSEGAAALFLLEDLHWFDAHSLEFVGGWLRSFAGTRTLVVTNFRPEFHPPWAEHADYRQIALNPLPEGAVGEMLAELMGSDPSLGDLPATVAARTGGNPFFVEETVRALAGDGSLAGERGRYRLTRHDAHVRVPPTVQAVLAGRIDRLPAWEKSTLQAASVIGREFSGSVLGATTDLPPDVTADMLRNLCTAELLYEADTVGDFRFWHPLTQEVAYRSLVGPARRRLHRATAAALLEQRPDDHDALAALLAQHFQAAADAVDAARWQIRAAMHAMRSDFTEAQRRLHLAVDHLDGAAESAETLALGVRARTLLLRLGARGGMSADEADRLFVQARPSAERLDEPALLAGLSIARGTVRVLRGDPVGCLESWHDALRHADRSGNLELSTWVGGIRAFAYAHAGPLATGIDAAAECIRGCGDDPNVGLAVAGFSAYDQAHCLGAMACIPAGQLAEARRLLDAAVAGYDARPVAEWRSITLSLFADLLSATGESALAGEASRAADEALRLARESGNVIAAIKARQAMGVIALLDGRPEHAVTALEDALAELRRERCGTQEEPATLAHLGQAHLARGDASAARSAVEEAVLIARRQGARVVECLAQLVRARVWRVTATGEPDLTRAHSALTAGEELAAQVGAATYAAFLAEERARLDGHTPAALAAVATAYDAIGATGHARRVRQEIAAEPSA